MLESYIAPLFMGYVDKYIQNLKPSDLSLSFWGGDVVLQNLELNLAVLQQELNLPVTFLSGKIHKLQLHVPWTRLIYEPVVITINTMEFIVTLKDSVDLTSKSNVDVEKEKVGEPDPNILNPPDKDENLPPGYVQGILNKVINNISFRVDNIIIKYVEDDMVFSVNVKSVDLYSSDETWKRAFTELTLPELVLRKICDIKDLTICLDQQNSSGRIDLYQDPVLYKCNLSVRMLSKYQNLNAMKAVNTNVNVYCESLDFSLTNQQMPMLVRLLKLVIGLFYGTLDLPGCEFRKHTAPQILKGEKQKQKSNLVVLDTSNAEISNSSWSSWMWSMIPGTENESLDNNSTSEDQTFSFGIYITQLSLTLKTMNQVNDSMMSSQRLEFLPLICLELSGCVVDFLSVGQSILDVKCGVQNLVGYTIGDICVCSISTTHKLHQESQEDSFDSECQHQDEIFLKVGTETRYDPAKFLRRSLFAIPDIIHESQTMKQQNSFNVIDVSHSSEMEESFDISNASFDVAPKHSKYETFDSLIANDLIAEKYGSILFNYFYEMEMPKVITNEIENIFLYPETDDKVHEVAEKYVYLSSCQVFLTSKCYHAFEWVTEVFATEIPVRKEKEKTFLDPFCMKQLQIANILSRKLEVRLCKSKVLLCATDHQRGNFANVSNANEGKEALLLEANDVIIQKIDPMYPTELIYMIQQGKLVKLNKMDNLNCNIDVKVYGLQGGLAVINNESLQHQSLVMLQPTDFYTNVTVPLLPENNLTTSVAVTCFNIECNKMSLSFQKSQLLICYYLMDSWLNDMVYNSSIFYLNSLFQEFLNPKIGPMNVTIGNIQSSLHLAKNIYAASGSIRSLVVTLGGKERNENLIFEAPCVTSNLYDVNSWLEKTDVSCSSNFIEFRMQYLKTNDENAELNKLVQMVSLQVAGAVVNIDHSFHSWLSTFETTSSKRSKFRSNSTNSAHRSLNRSVSSTPGRFKSYARMFGGSSYSPSRASKEKEKISSTPSLLTTVDEEQPQRFGEWIIEKINILKCLHIQIEIQSIILAMSKNGYETGCSLSSGILNNIQLKNQQGQLPLTLIICSPTLTMGSSYRRDSLFSMDLPVFQDNLVSSNETLPWTISSKEFTILTLIKNQYDEISHDKLYLCKPVSWNLVIASATSSNPKNKSQLQIINEDDNFLKDHTETKKKRFPHVDKISFKIDHKTAMGFVLHMHWSVCEWFICQEQLKLLFDILKTTVATLKTFSLNKEKFKKMIIQSRIQNINSSAQLKSTTTNDILSVSSTSTIDQVDAFSTLTDASSFPRAKTIQDPFIALWFQCTLPKIKFTIFSSVQNDSSFYRMTSEIEEIMFSLDYQKKGLDFTNKIAACAVYYSLLRYDSEPNGWTVFDHGYLLCQKETHNDSTYNTKTFLSAVYKHTFHHIQTVMSPDVTAAEHDVSMNTVGDRSQAALLGSQEDTFFKQELDINVLSFDLIFNAKPLISSLQIFQDLVFSDIFATETHGKQSKLEKSHNSQITFVPFPLLSVHMESFRIIVPPNESKKKIDYELIDTKESVILLHLSSINLSSTPINPLTKTVTNKILYRQMKQNYREYLRKIKIWNIQYQLDITNLGICTTNQYALEDSLPNQKMMMQQNPAVEWNLRKRYGQSLITPIFCGFDLNITIAPPIVITSKNKLSTITAAAFEVHSPRDVKVYFNTSQVALLKQHMYDGELIFNEFSNIFSPNNNPNTMVIPAVENIAEDSGYKTVTTATNSSTTVMDSLPTVELFASVSNVCIYINHKEYQQNFVMVSYPLVMINLNQPTLELSNVKESKVDFKLLGMEVNMSLSCTKENIPFNHDYNINVMSCGSGLCNAETGLLPTFLSANIILNKQLDCEIFMSFNQPIMLSHNVAVPNNILTYYQKIEKYFSETSQVKDISLDIESKVDGIDTDKSTMNYFPVKIKRFLFSTNRVLFKLATGLSGEDSSVNVQYEKFMCAVKFVFVNNTLNVISYDGNIDVLEVFFMEKTKRFNILQPNMSKVNASTEFYNNGSMHKHFLRVDIGVLQVKISQQFIEAFFKFYGDLAKAVSNSSSYPNDIENPEESSNRETVVKEIIASEDDLRNGTFEYIISTDDASMLSANQIFFFNNVALDKEVALMTWKYQQPRRISSISVIPLPFHLNSRARTKLNNEYNNKIPCSLQYFDVLNKKFKTFGEFAISENDPSFISIGDSKSLTACSTTWRLRVEIPMDILRENGDSTGVAVIPATSLAASTKVNSSYSNHYSLLLDMKFSASTVDFILLNSSSGTDSPTFLKPFFVDERTYCVDQMECIKLSFNNLTLKSCLVDGIGSAHAEFNACMSLRVMDFNDFCWMDVIKATPLKLQLAMGDHCFEKQSSAGNTPEERQQGSDRSSMHTDQASMQIGIGDMEVFFSQTSLHTLLMTAQAWKSIFDDSANELVLFNHYLVCNETQDIIHIQQINTDEDIVLKSGQVYPYSWLSRKTQKLRFCLESHGDWKWTEAVDLNVNGVTLHVLEHKQSVSHVYVEVKVLGGQQKQVIFHGCCSFINTLETDVLVELITQEVDTSNMLLNDQFIDVSTKFVLPANVSRPSHAISNAFLKTLRVTSSDTTNGETDAFELALLHHLQESFYFVKFQNGLLNCWLNLSYNDSLPGQLMLTVQPLMVVRNHMAEPLNILFQPSSTTREEKHKGIHVSGKGRTTQVLSLNNEDIYELTIVFQDNALTFQPSIPVNLKSNPIGFVQQLPNNIVWPYDVKSNPISTINLTSYTSLISTDDVGIKSQIQVQSSVASLSSPSINIDIWPCALFCNDTDLMLYLLVDQNNGYPDISIEHYGCTSQLYVKKNFKVGIQSKNGKIWSGNVSLDEDGISADFLYPGSYLNILLSDGEVNRSYHFTLSCSKVGFMTIYRMKKRFLIHNLSQIDLIAVPVMNAEKNEIKMDNLSATLISAKNALPCCRFNAFTTKDESPSSISIGFKGKQTEEETTADQHHLNVFGDIESEIDKALVANKMETSYCSSESVDPNLQLPTVHDFYDEKLLRCQSDDIKADGYLCLSKDHFRETFTINSRSESQAMFVTTTSMDQGVIHVFIDEDQCSIIDIHNKSNKKLGFKEVNSATLPKRHDILLTDTKDLQILNQNQHQCVQPKMFKQHFPKTSNKLEMICQFCLFSNQPVELSKPIVLKENIRNCKIFIPSCGEIYVSTYLQNARLFVVITDDVVSDKKTMATNNLCVPNIELCISSISTVLVDYVYPLKMESIFSVTASNLTVNHLLCEDKSTIKVSLDNLHIDNQMNDIAYHFPVLFLPLRQVKDRYHLVTDDVPFLDMGNAREEKFVLISFDVLKNDKNEIYFDNLSVKFLPCEIYLEDTFVYKLASIMESYIPNIGSTCSSLNTADQLKASAVTVLHPLKVNNVKIEKIFMLVTFHASVKVFLAASHIPLTFSPYICSPTQTILKELLRSMLYHYATQTLVSTGWILGSLEIIGNPTGLIHNVGRGLSDMVVLPYQGLIRGPTAFISGISSGASSLFKHMSKGALTSINNVSSSLSRNMDRLSLDELHSLIQEERRANSPTHISAGFHNAFGSLGLSLLGAVAGIVDHPIQNLTQANTTTEAVTGIFTGLVKGLLGVVTKPIGGAMEFVSQASQGVLQGSGLVKLPKRQYIVTSDNLDVQRKQESNMKLAWQYLHLDYKRECLIITKVQASIPQSKDMVDAILILTETALFIYNVNKEMITSAYPLNEIELNPKHELNHIEIEVRRVHPPLKKYPSASLDENPNYRQFFESFHQASLSCQNETLCDSLSSKDSTSITLHMESCMSELFVAVCDSNKRLMLEATPLAENVNICL